MARQPRIHVAGAVYHVIARGNNREAVFKESSDKQLYLQLLQHYKEKFPYQLWAYVLMDNHVHLLIRVVDDPLAKIMQGVQLTYTQYFNKKYQRVGHVFQQRYKAKMCRQDRYLLTLLRYIHYNPVKAGISADLNYPWSSHQYYLQAQTSSSLVDIAFVLGLFSEQAADAVQGYRAFMSQANIDPALDKTVYLSVPEPKKTAADSDKVNMAKLNVLLKSLALQTGVSVPLLCGSSRQRQVVQARRMFVYLAFKYYQVSSGDVAGLLQLSSAQVLRYFSANAGDPTLCQQAEQLMGSGLT